MVLKIDQSWIRARIIAAELLVDPPRDPTYGALFYHNTSIPVPWTRTRVRTARIGNHIFYRYCLSRPSASRPESVRQAFEVASARYFNSGQSLRRNASRYFDSSCKLLDLGVDVGQFSMPIHSYWVFRHLCPRCVPAVSLRVSSCEIISAGSLSDCF